MSYQILYTAKGAVQKRIKSSYRTPIFISCVILLIGITIHIIWPDALHAIKVILFPWTEESVVQAFGRMNNRILDGLSVGESFAVFCRDVISYAEY